MNYIVIGSSAEQKIPSLVLEHSIRKYSTVDGLQVIHTFNRTFPDPKNPENRSRTGFSFVRFAIPEMVGYQGTAAYLECDQLVFADVAELFSIPFAGATVLRTPNQASVLLLDCGRLRWKLNEILSDLDAGKFRYRDLMESLVIEDPNSTRGSIPVEWNSLEKYEPGKTKLLHYTAMNAQPWRGNWGHKLRPLWEKALKEAVASGVLSLDVVREEVGRRHVIRPVLDALR